MKWRETMALYSELTSFGQYFALNLRCDRYVVRAELEAFAQDWRPYNRNKPGFKRYGLSVTSLNGELSGDDDLTSLTEYNRLHGTNRDELSFRTLTKVYEGVPQIHGVVDPFREFLGRTHFLKFDAGGYFPYHRDAYRTPHVAFRIFVPLHCHSCRDFIFLLGNERLELEPGRAYFINTRMEHALFVMDSNSVHLVLNVELTRESLTRVEELLFSY